MKNMVEAAKQAAIAEIKEQQQKDMIKQFKTKMEQLANARRIVYNLERELDDLEYELDNGVG
jgi:methylthioribose-1-phosphate isomerase